MRLVNDSPSFTPVHSQIRAIGPRNLHLAKGRGCQQGPVDQLGHCVCLIGTPPARTELVMEAFEAELPVTLTPLADGHPRQTIRLAMSVLVSPALQVNTIWARWTME